MGYGRSYGLELINLISITIFSITPWNSSINLSNLRCEKILIRIKAQSQLGHTDWLLELCAYEILSELCEAEYGFDFTFVVSISHLICPEEGSYLNYQAVLFLQNQSKFWLKESQNRNLFQKGQAILNFKSNTSKMQR